MEVELFQSVVTKIHCWSRHDKLKFKSDDWFIFKIITHVSCLWLPMSRMQPKR